MAVKKNSFETFLSIPVLGEKKIPICFIRAPQIHSYGDDVKCLGSYEDHAILVQKKNRLLATFHPELKNDLRLHRYFISLCSDIENSGIGKNKVFNIS